MMKRTLIATGVAAGLLALPGLSVAQGGGFVEDAKANLSLRNLYFDGDYKDAPGSPSDRDWGQGFMLKFNSGYTQGPIGFGMDVFARAGIRLDSGGRNVDELGYNPSRQPPATMFPLEERRQRLSAELQPASTFAAKAQGRPDTSPDQAGRGLEPSLPVAGSQRRARSPPQDPTAVRALTSGTIE